SLLGMFLLSLATTAATAQTQFHELNARAKSLELDTPYVAPPGDPLAAERYGDGIGVRTPLEGWSMGKSITATLFGILLNRGAYELTQPAPIPEWQTAGDPRTKIRIEDLLHMSSGLRIRAPQDPDYDPSGPYPDHLYLYTGGI